MNAHDRNSHVMNQLAAAIQNATPTPPVMGSLAVPVPWDQHRALLLLAREMCQTLQVVNPAEVHDKTLAEINDQLARWENFQRIVAKAEAEYEEGNSLDSLTDEQGNVPGEGA